MQYDLCRCRRGVWIDDCFISCCYFTSQNEKSSYSSLHSLATVNLLVMHRSRVDIIDTLADNKNGKNIQQRGFASGHPPNY
jgi:hypothetical protein